jgi:hypothetical protein
MSFEQPPQNIPEAERVSAGDSPVTQAEIGAALKDLAEMPDEVDTSTGNEGSAQSETFYVEPDGAPENRVITESPETVTFNQPGTRELPRMPEKKEFEKSSPNEFEREDMVADDEVEQVEKRERETLEIERVRAELAEMKEYKHEFHDGGDEPPKERNGGGGDGGGGWERPASTHTAYEREEVTHYKVCENCGGSGRIWFVFKCKKCNGAGEIKSGKSVSMKPYQTT